MTIRGKTVMITNDAVAAALFSTHFAKDGEYVTIIEPPRMLRPDAYAEIAKVMNVLSRIKPRLVVGYSLTAKESSALRRRIGDRFVALNKLDDFTMLGINIKECQNVQPEDALQRLLSKTKLKLPIKAIAYGGVVDVGAVIAANYAVYHGAKFFKFDVPKQLVESTTETLNRIDSISIESIRLIDAIELGRELDNYLPDSLITTPYDTTLFITEGIPFGFTWKDKKVIHANTLQLGTYLAHNICEYEWGIHQRLGLIGLYVADRAVQVIGEYEGFAKAVLRGRGLTKKKITTHPKLTELDIMTIPYDILYVATHAKQLAGFIEKYNVEIDGANHLVEIKRASGTIGMVGFIVSVDGISKDEDGWKSKVHGKTWHRFVTTYLTGKNPLPDPLDSQPTVLSMRAMVLGDEHGENSPFPVQRLASTQRPIVIANACGSWNDISPLFMFAGASSYIGTLWATKGSVAINFANKLNSTIFDLSLNEAFFYAKNSLSKEIDKMNYVISASFENKYDPQTPFSSDGLTELKERVNNLIQQSKFNIAKFNESTPEDIKRNAGIDLMWYKNILKDLKKAGDK